MSTEKTARLTTVRARIKRIWVELKDANRRMFVIRSGEYWMQGQPEKESRSSARQRTTIPAH